MAQPEAEAAEVPEIPREMGPERPPLRSLRSEIKCKLFFRNMSSRAVQLIWLNYDGSEVTYTLLRPGGSFIMNSYVTHPWILRDNGRLNLMALDAYVVRKNEFVSANLGRSLPQRRLTSLSRVFHPVAHQENELLQINIRNQVHSLKVCCFHTLIDHKLTTDMSVVPLVLVREFEQYKNGTHPLMDPAYQDDD